MLAMVCLPHGRAVALAAQRPTARHFIAGRVVVEHVIGDSDGIRLQRPSAITAANGNIFVYDRGTKSVTALSSVGKPLWTYARSRAGGGAFTDVFDMKTSWNGDLLVLDEPASDPNGRVTVVDPRGQLRTEAPAPEEMRSLLPPFGGATSAGVPVGTETMWVSIGGGGKAPARQPFPPSISFPKNVVGDPLTATTDSGAAIAYRWSSQIVLLRRDGSVQQVLPGVEAIPFPGVKMYPITIPGATAATITRVDPKAVPCAVSVTAFGNQLYVVFAGASKDRGRIIDLYDIAKGQYTGSYMLPVKPRMIAALPGGRLVTLEDDLEPVIKIWSLSVPGSPRGGAP